MIGNDVIDLKQARLESDWKRPRFLQKLFTDKELDFIHDTEQSDIAVWLLWSRKESVYKIVSRMITQRFFAPKRFESSICANDYIGNADSNVGQLTFEHLTFTTKSTVTNNYIHTIAQWANDENDITQRCFYLDKNDYKSQSRHTHEKLLFEYAKKTKRPVEEISILKDNRRVPHLYKDQYKLTSSISISHHGHYGGYAFQL